MKQSAKEYLFTVREPGLTSVGNLPLRHSNFLPTLHLSPNDCKSAVSIDLDVTNEFYLIGEFTNVDSVNKED